MRALQSERRASSRKLLTPLKYFRYGFTVVFFEINDVINNQLWHFLGLRVGTILKYAYVKNE